MVPKIATRRIQPKKIVPNPNQKKNDRGEKKLRIIPLGGQQEVGRNMTVFEFGNDIVILDMGLQFPEEDMHGIDYIIPNVSYLKGKEKNIRAVVFSHGHLDHIGAAPILLEKLGYPPIVGRPLTLAMIKHRQEDYKPNTSKRLKTIMVKKVTDQFKFGELTIKFFQVEHSIMDAVGVIIQSPTATILHPGDWTLEKDTKGKPTVDYTDLAKLKRPTVLMLESLGSTDVRPSTDYERMHKNLIKIITEAPGRLIIGTFASQIERIGWIITEAEKLGKKIALDGYSMKINIEIARELGYIKAKKDTLIKVNEIEKYPDNKIVVIATGAQGEDTAVLSRIIAGSHRFIRLKKSDTVVLSSSIIPGNENSIQRLKDGLYRECNNVIHGEIMDIHVSGHADRQDIAHMIKTIKPDYFLPVYAYHYMLKEAAKLARETGMPEKNVFVLDDGQVAEFDRAGGRPTSQKVPTDHVFVDGLGVGDISNIVLRDRQMMAEDGMIVVIATIDTKKCDLVQNPDLISRGFIYLKENKTLIEETRNRVKKIFKGNIKTDIDDNYFKNKIRNDIGEFLYQKTKRRPMVLPVIIKV
ncbi:MAG: ribonuclease J [Candidatus Buchananbacteria bacterium]|nr:ribonuclease J [Candidatus Buchananbacteria bacterium]